MRTTRNDNEDFTMFEFAEWTVRIAHKKFQKMDFSLSQKLELLIEVKHSIYKSYYFCYKPFKTTKKTHTQSLQKKHKKKRKGSFIKIFSKP